MCGAIIGSVLDNEFLSVKQFTYTTELTQIPFVSQLIFKTVIENISVVVLRGAFEYLIC